MGTCFRPFHGISVFARVATGNVKNYTQKKAREKKLIPLRLTFSLNLAHFFSLKSAQNAITVSIPTGHDGMGQRGTAKLEPVRGNRSRQMT